MCKLFVFYEIFNGLFLFAVFVVLAYVLQCLAPFSVFVNHGYSPCK